MTPSGVLLRAAFLCLLLISPAALAQASDETKPDTQRSTFADVIPDFANTTSVEEMQAVIVKGIGSDDPEKVEQMLRQIGAIAMLGTVEDFHTDIPDGFKEPHQRFEPLRRQFAAVPGLRERLMEFVRESADLNRIWTDPEVEYDSLSEAERQQVLTWSSARLALPVYFPQDPVVHDFLIDWWREVDDASGLATLLYSGRFRSEPADEIRIAARHAPPTADAVAAAKGLALSGSDAALAALVANLDRRDHALQTIVEAIATFGDQAKPHLDSLLDLREELDAYVADEDDLLALDPSRNQSIIETITSLAAEFETLDDY
ncbi:MAG: hypothetical protein OXI79_02510 [Gammaproteobacteria bacterium]|nr:hypothetical protein [Gammaproteobacteria bacterium]